MGSPKYFELSLVLGVATAPCTALAQDPMNNLPKPEDIIVTGKGLQAPPSTVAYDTEVLDRSTLTSTASGRIEDALANIAGFQQFRRSDSRYSNPSAQGATLRALGGNATSRALVLLDGVPLSDPFFGYIPFSSIAPERLSSARVTRGGGSGPFGAGALAGTIELFSSDRSQLDPVSGQLLISDRADTQADLQLAPALGDGFAVLSGRWDRGRGFYTTPIDQRVPASARSRYDSWSAEGRAVVSLTSSAEIQARMVTFGDQRTLRFDGADSTSSGSDASFRVVGKGRWAFDILGYVQARNFSNIVVSSTRFVPVLDQRNTPSTGLGGKIELRPPVGTNHTLRLGADYRRSSGQTSEVAISAFSGKPRARRTAGGVNSDLGLFLEDDWEVGPITLTAGIRADYTTISGGFFRETDAEGTTLLENRKFPTRRDWSASIRGGAVLRLSTRLSARMAGYTGLRVPTLNELYRPFTVFPVVTLANADLSNERLEGAEIGLTFDVRGRGRLSLTAFDNRVKGAIANVTIGENLRQRQNIDQIQSRGLEFDGQAEVGALTVGGSLALVNAIARGSGDAEILDGNRPAQTPKLIGNAWTSIKVGDFGMVRLSVRHIGTQFEDDLESELLPAFTTFDVFGQAALGNGWNLILRGENISDVRSITRNQSGSIDLGLPRTAWVGLRLAY